MPAVLGLQPQHQDPADQGLHNVQQGSKMDHGMVEMLGCHCVLETGSASSLAFAHTAESVCKRDLDRSQAVQERASSCSIRYFLNLRAEAVQEGSRHG
jgi:hypothetical protein